MLKTPLGATLRNGLRVKVDPLFLRTAELMTRRKSGILDLTPRAREIQDWVERRPSNRSAPVVYEKEADDFNRAFFLRNIYKNLFNIAYALEAGLLPSVQRDIVDLGSGAGVSAIAWSLLTAGSAHRVTLVDRSKRQLTLAAGAFAVIGLPHAEALNGFFPCELRKLPDGIRLLSYWLCEQDIRAMHSEIIYHLFAERAIVTDYSEVTRNLIRMYPRLRAVQWSFEVKLKPEVGAYIRQDRLRINGSVIKAD
jgi:hypothetical protein